jgi:NAD(P)-dependent dehydrogenase (short-subunit alcohol dehydrogenase family)
MKAFPLRVVVITGASSGIGRATAHAFAREGAHLVLAARQVDDLNSTAAECRELGAGEIVIGATDVTDEEAVAQLAERAVTAFGSIDVWLNNAGVVALGRFDELPSHTFRRVIETNFFGCVHGSRAALRVFRRQGHGVLINMSSILAVVGEPYASAYVSSKFAIRGLSECLRQEVRDIPGIRVCIVMPATIDTPIFRVGANHAPRRVKAVEPVYDPVRVAREIVELARWPRREAVVGGFGHLFTLGKRVAPALTEWAVALAGPRMQFEHARPEVSSTDGNLFTPAPTESHAVSGGWRNPSSQPWLALGTAVLAAALLCQAARAIRPLHARGNTRVQCR